MRKNPSKAPSQRQLRVGEEIRHALSEIFLQGNIYQQDIDDLSITVSQVKISPDLKNASAYVSPLGGKASSDFIEGLNRIAPQISHLVAKKVKLKFAPKIQFRNDNSFEIASEIEKLFDSIKEPQPVLSDSDA